MRIPDALNKLFDWIESNGLCEETDIGRVGYLYPLDKLRNEWGDTERSGGTSIEFFAEPNSDSYHFISGEIRNRLRVFARTGGDGSVAAFWLDDDGNQKIVHIGSGSGSILACVLAEDPVDFLRLIAIGYDEICWNDNFALTAAESHKSNDFWVKPNLKFLNWLTHEFNLAIPKTALEIVKNPAEFGDENSNDPFCRWLEIHGA
ncbi:MAG: hypothetical protein ACRBBR_04720 [Cellvibrionaceae bacterium]